MKGNGIYVLGWISLCLNRSSTAIFARRNKLALKSDWVKVMYRRLRGFRLWHLNDTRGKSSIALVRIVYTLHCHIPNYRTSYVPVRTASWNKSRGISQRVTTLEKDLRGRYFWMSSHSLTRINSHSKTMYLVLPFLIVTYQVFIEPIQMCDCLNFKYD